MQALQWADAVLYLAIDGDILHRAGTIERHKRHDILDAGRFHPPQRIHHAGGFHLEHGHGLRLGVKLIGRRVINRDRGDIDIHPAQLQQIDRVLNHRERLEAEEVELHQTGLLDPFHIELGRGHIRARILIERHQQIERAITDHHTCRVSGGVAQQALHLLRIAEQARDDLFLRARPRAGAARRPVLSRC